MAKGSPAGAEDRADGMWQVVPGELAESILRPEIPAVPDEVLERLRVEGHPADPPVDGALERNLRTAIIEGLEQFARLVDGSQTQPDTDMFESLGRVHARARLPLANPLGYLRVSALVAWRRFAGAVHAAGLDGAVLGPLGEALFDFLHRLSSAAERGYAAARADALDLTQARRQALLRTLVLEQAEKAELEWLARRANWTPPSQVVAIVQRGRPDGLDGLPPTALAAPLAGNMSLLLAADDAESYATALAAASSTTAIGPPVAWHRAKVSYERAEAVLDLRDRGMISGSHLRADEHRIQLFLDGHRDILGELVERWVRPLDALPPSRREPLLETLATWMELPEQPAAIARRLHVHVQTVRYRQRRLREHLGDDLASPDRRLEVSLAVRHAGIRPHAHRDEQRDEHRNGDRDQDRDEGRNGDPRSR